MLCSRAAGYRGSLLSTPRRIRATYSRARLPSRLLLGLCFQAIFASILHTEISIYIASNNSTARTCARSVDVWFCAVFAAAYLLSKNNYLGFCARDCVPPHMSRAPYGDIRVYDVGLLINRVKRSDD